MATLLNPFIRALDANGDAVSGAQLAVFEAGTTTPVTTYSDRALSSAQAQPLIANSAGEFAQSFVASGIYKIRVSDADGVTLYENDNVRIADRPDDPVFFDTSADLLASTDTYAEGTFAIALREDRIYEAAASGATDHVATNAGGQKFYVRPTNYDTVAELIASTEDSRFEGAIWEAGGFRYEEAASGATDQHVTTAGGVKLYVVSGESGRNLNAFSANGDDSTDNANQFAAAVASAGNLLIPPGTFSTSSEVSITNAVSVSGWGGGAVKNTSADEHIISIGHATGSSLLSPVSVSGATFKEQPVSSTDDYAAISLSNVDQPKILANWVDDVETGIRAGYVVAGEQSQYPITGFNHVKNAREFGIEHINAQFPVTIGNVIQNSGTQVGSHGLRYTAADFGTDGFVSVGNLIADRSTNGISVQRGVEHGLISAVIKNVAEDGFRPNLGGTTEAQQHLMQLVVTDATLDGVNLTDLSHCMVDCVTNNSDGNGVRLGNATNDGHHIVRQVSLDDDNALRVVSNYNHVTVVADSTDATTAVLVSGSFNIVDVIVMDSVDFSAYITGNDNIVRVIQDGGGTTTGLRIDGDRNTVQANIEDTATITGDNNVLFGQFRGNVFCSGVGNDFTGVKGFSSRARTTDTTDGSGNITVPHGLQSAAWSASSVVATVLGSNDYTARIQSVTSSNIIINIKNSSGANVTLTSVTVSWQAEAAL